MDNLKLLRCLVNSSCFAHLTVDELKLYILLLVNAAGTEVSSKIKLEQIERASGKTPTFIELKSMMDSLKEGELAVMEGFIEHRGGKNSEMRYRLKKPDAVVIQTGRSKAWQ